MKPISHEEANFLLVNGEDKGFGMLKHTETGELINVYYRIYKGIKYSLYEMTYESEILNKEVNYFFVEKETI